VGLGDIALVYVAQTADIRALPNPLPIDAKRRPERRRFSLARAMPEEGLEPPTRGL
jgi:hypothetical protein